MLLLFVMPVVAQPTPVTVFYAYDQPGANRWLVDNTMHVILERQDFLVAAKRDPKLLEISVEGKVTRDPGDNSKGFSFTLGFYRAGEKLGEAAEYCKVDNLSDCSDQLASDIVSADAIHH